MKKREIKPRDVTDSQLAKWRRNRKSLYWGMGFQAAIGIFDLIFGVLWWVPLVPATVIAGYLVIWAGLNRKIAGAELLRSRVPKVWPPQEFQCSICGLVDELDYGGKDWAPYFSHYVHEDCKNWVWTGWAPPRDKHRESLDSLTTRELALQCGCEICMAILGED